MALKYYFPTMPKTISLLAYLSEKQTKVSIYWKIKNKFCLIKTFFILTSNTLLLLLHHPLNPTSSPVRKKKIYKMWTTSSKIKNRRKCLQFFFCAFFNSRKNIYITPQNFFLEGNFHHFDSPLDNLFWILPHILIKTRNKTDQARLQMFAPLWRLRQKETEKKLLSRTWLL